jgi:hypothetical protein
MKKNRSKIFFSLPCEKSGFFVLVFASEAKRKWKEAKPNENEAKTMEIKPKRSESVKVKKDKVKFWDNL